MVVLSLQYSPGVLGGLVVAVGCQLGVKGAPLHDEQAVCVAVDLLAASTTKSILLPNFIQSQNPIDYTHSVCVM